MTGPAPTPNVGTPVKAEAQAAQAQADAAAKSVSKSNSGSTPPPVPGVGAVGQVAAGGSGVGATGGGPGGNLGAITNMTFENNLIGGPEQPAAKVGSGAATVNTGGPVAATIASSTSTATQGPTKATLASPTTTQAFNPNAAGALGYKIITEPGGEISLLAPGGELLDQYGNMISNATTRAANQGPQVTDAQSRALNQQAIASSTAPIDYATFGQNATFSQGPDGTYVVTGEVNGKPYAVNTGIAYLDNQINRAQAVEQAYNVLQGSYQGIQKSVPSGASLKGATINTNTGESTINLEQAPGQASTPYQIKGNNTFLVSYLNNYLSAGNTIEPIRSPTVLSNTTPAQDLVKYGITDTIAQPSIYLPANWVANPNGDLFIDGNKPTLEQAEQYANALSTWYSQLTQEQKSAAASSSAQAGPSGTPNWYQQLLSTPQGDIYAANLAAIAGITPATFQQPNAPQTLNGGQSPQVGISSDTSNGSQQTTQDQKLQIGKYFQQTAVPMEVLRALNLPVPEVLSSTPFGKTYSGPSPIELALITSLFEKNINPSFSPSSFATTKNPSINYLINQSRIGGQAIADFPLAVLGLPQFGYNLLTNPIGTGKQVVSQTVQGFKENPLASLESAIATLPLGEGLGKVTSTFTGPAKSAFDVSSLKIKPEAVVIRAVNPTTGEVETLGQILNNLGVKISQTQPAIVTAEEFNTLKNLLATKEGQQIALAEIVRKVAPEEPSIIKAQPVASQEDILKQTYNNLNPNLPTVYNSDFVALQSSIKNLIDARNARLSGRDLTAPEIEELNRALNQLNEFAQQPGSYVGFDQEAARLGRVVGRIPPKIEYDPQTGLVRTYQPEPDPNSATGYRYVMRTAPIDTTITEAQGALDKALSELNAQARVAGSYIGFEQQAPNIARIQARVKGAADIQKALYNAPGAPEEENLQGALRELGAIRPELSELAPNIGRTLSRLDVNAPRIETDPKTGIVRTYQRVQDLNDPTGYRFVLRSAVNPAEALDPQEISLKETLDNFNNIAKQQTASIFEKNVGNNEVPSSIFENSNSAKSLIRRVVKVPHQFIYNPTDQLVREYDLRLTATLEPYWQYTKGYSLEDLQNAPLGQGDKTNIQDAINAFKTQRQNYEGRQALNVALEDLNKIALGVQGVSKAERPTEGLMESLEAPQPATEAQPPTTTEQKPPSNYQLNRDGTITITKPLQEETISLTIPKSAVKQVQQLPPGWQVTKNNKLVITIPKVSYEVEEPSLAGRLFPLEFAIAKNGLETITKPLQLQTLQPIQREISPQAKELIEEQILKQPTLTKQLTKVVEPTKEKTIEELLLEQPQRTKEKTTLLDAQKKKVIIKPLPKDAELFRQSTSVEKPVVQTGEYHPDIENAVFGPIVGIPESASLLGLGYRGSILSPADVQALAAQGISVPKEYIGSGTANIASTTSTAPYVARYTAEAKATPGSTIMLDPLSQQMLSNYATNLGTTPSALISTLPIGLRQLINSLPSSMQASLLQAFLSAQFASGNPLQSNALEANQPEVPLTSIGTSATIASPTTTTAALPPPGVPESPILKYSPISSISTLYSSLQQALAAGVISLDQYNAFQQSLMDTLLQGNSQEGVQEGEQVTGPVTVGQRKRVLV